jgi:phosphoribosylamine--glycine ligase
LATEGYPGSYEKGHPISGLDDLGSEVTVFHAGTKLEAGQLMSNGGRVLNLVGRGADVATAAEAVYGSMSKINFPGSFHRTDIGGG